MRYERDLQVRLRERFRRLYKSDFQGHFTQSGYIRDFILKTPALRAIVEYISRSEPDLDPAEWVTSHFAHREYEWPPTEQQKAKVLWHLINDLTAENGANSFNTLGRYFALDATTYDELARAVTEQVFEPFI